MINSGAAALVFVCIGCSFASGLESFEAVEPHMGTLVRIKLYAASEQQAQAAFRAAFDRIAQLDRELSDYRSDSELNRVCITAVGTPVKAGSDLLRVLEASQKLAAQTKGAFDVTLGPVIRVWRQARKDGKLPDATALRDARARSGYRKLHIDEAAGTVLLEEPGMQLDVGGIAKGDAADAALAVLSAAGIHSALVAVSGDLAFSDAPPGERGWRIGVDASGKASADFTRILELHNGAVSTSGSEEQHLDAAGKRYSHIIDPASGTGLTRPMTVTILAPRGIEADSLATAVSVLGPERGMELVKRRPGTAALIVTGEGTIETPNWPHP